MILEIRLTRAEQLLLKSSLAVGQTSNKLVFSDASNMNKTFQKDRKKNPSEYWNIDSVDYF